MENIVPTPSRTIVRRIGSYMSLVPLSYPQQNGIAERKNMTLKDMMNAKILSSGMLDDIWGEAILSACHVLNRVPHKELKYELNDA